MASPVSPGREGSSPGPSAPRSPAPVVSRRSPSVPPQPPSPSPACPQAPPVSPFALGPGLVCVRLAGPGWGAVGCSRVGTGVGVQGGCPVCRVLGGRRAGCWEGAQRSLWAAAPGRVAALAWPLPQAGVRAGRPAHRLTAGTERGDSHQEEGPTSLHGRRVPGEPPVSQPLYAPRTAPAGQGGPTRQDWPVRGRQGQRGRGPGSEGLGAPVRGSSEPGQ